MSLQLVDILLLHLYPEQGNAKELVEVVALIAA
jgi:hypothetical protein